MAEPRSRNRALLGADETGCVAVEAGQPRSVNPALDVRGRRRTLPFEYSFFPLMAECFARAKDDGRAEALLIAEWGRRRGGS